MFSYYGSECFCNNKSLCKQDLTLKKKKQGSSNAQQKYILKRRHGHRKVASVHTGTFLRLPGLQERKVLARPATVFFSHFVFGHHGWADKHAVVETVHDTNDDSLWSYGSVSRRLDRNMEKKRPNLKRPPYGRYD